MTAETDIKEVMIKDYNKESRSYLCYIPKTSQAYYIKGKQNAENFCKHVNLKFFKGLLKINENGKVILNNK